MPYRAEENHQPSSSLSTFNLNPALLASLHCSAMLTSVVITSCLFPPTVALMLIQASTLVGLADGTMSRLSGHEKQPQQPFLFPLFFTALTTTVATTGLVIASFFLSLPITPCLALALAPALFLFSSFGSLASAPRNELTGDHLHSLTASAIMFTYGCTLAAITLAALGSITLSPPICAIPLILVATTAAAKCLSRAQPSNNAQDNHSGNPPSYASVLNSDSDTSHPPYKQLHGGPAHSQ